jgi:hypothetical protein
MSALTKAWAAMREASEIANEICGCSDRDQHRRDVKLIEADRKAAALAERARIVAWLREQDGYDDVRANCIEAREHLK